MGGCRHSRVLEWSWCSSLARARVARDGRAMVLHFHPMGNATAADYAPMARPGAVIAGPCDLVLLLRMVAAFFHPMGSRFSSSFFSPRFLDNSPAFSRLFVQKLSTTFSTGLSTEKSYPQKNIMYPQVIHRFIHRHPIGPYANR